MDKAPFRVIRGLDEKISIIPNSDGAVYFATDTKKIYLDNNGSRLSMGGNTGIYYAHADFEGIEGPEFFFQFTDIDGENLPNNDDLIINSDGCFYKVLERQEEEIKTSRLTIAGTGTGGSLYGSLSMNVEGGLMQRTAILHQSLPIKFTMTATDVDGASTGDGRYEIRINNIVRKTGIIANSALLDEPIFNTVDLQDLFTLTGTYKVQIVCYAYIGGSSEASVSKRFDVNITEFTVNWEYDDKTVNHINEDFEIIWGLSVDGKDIQSHVIIDDTHMIDLDDTVLRIPQSELASYGLTHGVHKFELRASALIGDDPNRKSSNSIVKNLIFYDPNKTEYIVACDFFNTKVQQYSTIQLPVRIYHASNINGTATIEFKVNSGLKSTLTNCANFTQYTFAYTPEDEGFVQLEFVCGGTTMDLVLDVQSLNINITEVPNYKFKFKATDFSNNDEVKAWGADKNMQLIFSENFDWISGGLKAGEDDMGPYFRIQAGTTMEIPYSLFGNYDLKNTGACFKMIFKAQNCRDYDAIVADSMQDRGVLLKAQGSTLKSASNTLDARYCEDTYIEYEFDICKYNANNVNSQYVTLWLDGIPVSVIATTENDSFLQTSPKNLIIGSDDCDVCVYLIKFYEKSLSFDEHLQNFIIDAPNGAEIIARFNRNDIVAKDEAGNKYISPELLAEKNPDCNVYIYELEHIPTEKLKVSEGKYVNGSFTHLKGSKEALYFDPAVKVGAQGTSSMNYGISAYNFDTKFNEEFGLDDKAIPVNYYNTKMNVASCEGANNALNQEWYNRYQPYKTQKRLKARDDGKIARDTMQFKNGVVFIKDNNKKTNENAATDNNIFKEIPGYVQNPYPRMYSIGNMGNSKKNTEVFHGAGNDYECCIENADNNTGAQRMLFVGGFIHAATEGGEDREIALTLPEDMFDSAGYVIPTADWGTTYDAVTDTYLDNKTLWRNSLIGEGFFEFRYCKDEDAFTSSDLFSTYTYEEYQWELSNRFLRLVHWFAKNNPYNATGEPLKETVTFGAYEVKGIKRMAYSNYPEDSEVLKGTVVPGGTFTHDTPEYRAIKMLHESEDYLILDSIIYHYLFIERHTMVDNVAKNTFWNTEDGIHWELTKNYDNDTADGVNNDGYLAFDYGVEVMDNTANDTAIFNARPSAWLHFAHRLLPLREKMYSVLYSRGAWSDTEYLNMFNAWQNAIPEVCWIEDAYRKYFRPNNVYNNDGYLKRLAGGKKTHQRKQYEVYQNQYMNSQYKADTKTSIYWRSEQQENKDIQIDGKYQVSATVKLYADGYLNVAIASGAGESSAINIHVRGKKGDVIPFVKTQDSPFNNATCYIYNPNLYQEFVETEKLYPAEISATAANKLRKISFIPSNEAQKYMLKYSLSVGPNVEEIIFQDCKIGNTQISLDLVRNTRLKVLDTIGSELFTGYAIADGAPLNTFKIERPTTLQLSNLRHLDPLKFLINNYDYLSKVLINNIDYNGINSKEIIKKLQDKNIRLEYDLQNVNWVFDDNDKITDASIPILDYLQNYGLTTGKKTKALSLTGNALIPHTAYGGANALSLYEKYGLMSNDDSTYPNLILNFQDENFEQKLYTISIKNGDGKIVWSRQVNSFDQLNNSLLSESALGAFDAAAAIAKSESNEYVYEFNNKWTYTTASGRTEEVSSSTSNDYAYLDLAKLQNCDEENVIIEPVYRSTIRRYNINFYNNQQELLYSTQATYRTPFSSIKPAIVPIKDDSDLPLTQTYILKGYSAINGASTIINEETWQVTADVNLYTVFIETDIYKVDYSAYLNIEKGSVKGLLKTGQDYIYNGQKIVIPANVTDIATKAFGQDYDTSVAATPIKYVFIAPGSQLQKIGSYAFAGRNSIKYFDFANAKQLTLIDQHAFRWAPILNATLYKNHEIVLPNGLTTIEKYAFNQCSGDGDQTHILTFVVPASVTTMLDYSISNWTEVYNSVIEIGSSNHASALRFNNYSENIIHSNHTGGNDQDIKTIRFYTNNYTSEECEQFFRVPEVSCIAV